MLKTKGSPKFLDIMRGRVDEEKIASLLERIAAEFPGAQEPMLVVLDGSRYQMTMHWGGFYQAKFDETAAGISKRISSYLSGFYPEGKPITRVPSAVVDFSTDPKLDQAYEMLRAQGHKVIQKNIEF